jgi:hypothetical protein
MFSKIRFTVLLGIFTFFIIALFSTPPPLIFAEGVKTRLKACETCHKEFIKKVDVHGSSAQPFSLYDQEGWYTQKGLVTDKLGDIMSAVIAEQLGSVVGNTAYSVADIGNVEIRGATFVQKGFAVDRSGNIHEALIIGTISFTNTENPARMQNGFKESTFAELLKGRSPQTDMGNTVAMTKTEPGSIINRWNKVDQQVAVLPPNPAGKFLSAINSRISFLKGMLNKDALPETAFSLIENTKAHLTTAKIDEGDAWYNQYALNGSTQLEKVELSGNAQINSMQIAVVAEAGSAVHIDKRSFLKKTALTRPLQV